MNPETRVRRLVVGLLAAATAVSVTACGAGRDATTYQQRNNAESSNASVGELAIRNVQVQAPPDGELYEVGDHASVVLTVANGADTPDRLLEVTSSAAREVIVRDSGRRAGVIVPAGGSTRENLTLELRGLTRTLRPGNYVDLTFRFRNGGSTQVLAPIATTGETDRPIYTGERFEGGEEPALQAPAGGDHGAGEAEGEDH